MPPIIKYILVFAIVALLSCGESAPEAGELILFKSPKYGSELLYPKNWEVTQNSNRLLVTSSKGIADRAKNPYSKSEEKGMKIDLFSYAFKDDLPLEELFTKTQKYSLEFYSAPRMKVMNNLPAYVRDYTLLLPDGAMEGTMIITKTNKYVYFLTLEAYGETDKLYKPLFDTIIGSFKIK